MTISEHKRQQQRNRKSAKEREARKSNSLISSGVNKHMLFREAVNAPFFDCVCSPEDLKSGLINIIYAKQLHNDMIAASIILLDVYCLGVKNAFRVVENHSKYQEIKIKLLPAYQSIHPVCAKKMIEGSVEYARRIGFSPHNDFKSSFQLFSTVESSLCNKTYEYGLDGKPFYIAGPHETPAKIRTILNTLTKHCGEGGFDYMIPAPV